MKKLAILICFLLLCTPYNFKVIASSSFGRITSSYAYLYKSATNEIEGNVICYLEESYFCEIVLDYDSKFYKVNYNGVSGFALKSNITKVIGTPQKPYPTANITTIDSKCYLRSTPNTLTDNILTVVPANCEELGFVGKIYGEEAIDYKGNLWYMVSYFGITGYIYSGYIKSISTIPVSVEVIQIYASNLKDNPTPLNNFECASIIILLSVPIILIVIIMYKSPKTEKPKKITRKIPKSNKIDKDELL